MNKPSGLYLGAARPLNGAAQVHELHLAPHHLTTHAAIVGMTGSGKTGLLTVMVEEALRAEVPVLMIDIKGDLPNLLLALPTQEPALIEPWLEGMAHPGDPRSLGELATELSQERDNALHSWGINASDLDAYRRGHVLRVITPGSTAGEALHVLSALERPNPRWHDDIESARASLSAAVSLVLRLVGRDADPARSREHVMLSVLAERRLRAGGSAELAGLLDDLEHLPLAEVGALPVDRFLPKKERQALAAALNSLLASPTFAAWREGTTLDVGSWLTPVAGAKTPAVIVSVAHLDDEERNLVLGVLLEELLTWVRTLSGSRKLRALVVFDEVYGFMPPHPANPPTKRPLVALMKQARAFGVGIVVATQNPMDLDYRALSNAGLWCIGRLQTDADRARVVEALTGDDKQAAARLSDTVRKIAPRWFVLRDAHGDGAPVFLQPRYAISLLRGPMTRRELKRAIAARVSTGECSSPPLDTPSGDATGLEEAPR